MQAIDAVRWIVAILIGGLIGLSAAHAVASDWRSVVLASQQAAALNKPLEVTPQRLVVKFRPDIPVPVVNLFTTALDTRMKDAIPELGTLVLELPPGVDERSYAQLFQDFLPVEYAEPEYILPPAQSHTVMPNDPWFDLSRDYGWHLNRIGAPAAWYYQRGHPGVVIAILDTGVEPVPDLAAKLVPGWNFYNNNSNTSDPHGHGTYVAGVAAAITNNGTGVAGVAWNCRIMPLRVAAPDGHAGSVRIAQALVWAANNGARVANISYDVSGVSLISDAARYFMEHARGVVTVAAGNATSGGASYKPDDPHLINLSAIDRDNTRAVFSCYGNDTDLCAPGNYIITTGRAGYFLVSGTSFAAPIAAGVAALVISANPHLTARQVEQILERSAVDLGPPGWDWEYGWGCVNAYRAVMLARGLLPESTPPTVRITSPSNGAAVRGELWINCEVTDQSGISHVEFYVNGFFIGRRLSPPYRVWWNSFTVSPGPATLSVVAYDGAGNRGVHSIQILVDNPWDYEPPTVTITSINGQTPVDGMVLQGTDLTVRVNARDDVGVVSAELYVNDIRRVGTRVAPFTLRWSTRTLPPGEHTLYVIVYDGVGQSGTSQTVRVIKR